MKMKTRIKDNSWKYLHNLYFNWVVTVGAKKMRL